MDLLLVDGWGSRSPARVQARPFGPDARGHYPSNTSRGCREGGPADEGYWQGLPQRAAPSTVEGMDNQSETRDFLATRRAKITPGAGGAAGLRRQPPRARTAPRGSGDAGRRQRRVLHPAGTRKPLRRLGGRAGCPGAGRCSWTRPNGPTCSTWPGPPAPAASRGAAAAAVQPSPCAQRAADARRDHQRPGVCAQRAPGRPRGQPAGPRHVLRDVRRPGPAGQLCAVPLPGRPFPQLLPGLGARRE